MSYKKPYDCTIDPYHARVCCGSKLRLRNIQLLSGGLNVQKPMGPQAFGVSGALTIPNFLIIRTNS